MMPSSVAPTCLSHFCASASFVVAGDSRKAYDPSASSLRRALEFLAPRAQRLVRRGCPRRRRAGRTRSAAPASRRRVFSHGSPPDGCAAAARRRKRRGRAARRFRRRARSALPSARTAASTTRGNSASATARISTAARSCRRRETAGSESRPISARIANSCPPGSCPRRGPPSARRELSAAGSCAGLTPNGVWVCPRPSPEGPAWRRRRVARLDFRDVPRARRRSEEAGEAGRGSTKNGRDLPGR